MKAENNNSGGYNTKAELALKKELQALTEEYRRHHAVWQALIQEEKDERKTLYQQGEELEVEAEEIKENIAQMVQDNKLRERQKKALQELKEAERKLFNWALQHVVPEEKDALRRLASDYAGRISYLRRFLAD